MPQWKYRAEWSFVLHHSRQSYRAVQATLSHPFHPQLDGSNSTRTEEARNTKSMVKSIRVVSTVEPNSNDDDTSEEDGHTLLNRTASSKASSFFLPLDCVVYCGVEVHRKAHGGKDAAELDCTLLITCHHTFSHDSITLTSVQIFELPFEEVTELIPLVLGSTAHCATRRPLAAASEHKEDRSRSRVDSLVEGETRAENTVGDVLKNNPYFDILRGVEFSKRESIPPRSLTPPPTPHSVKIYKAESDVTLPTWFPSPPGGQLRRSSVNVPVHSGGEEVESLAEEGRDDSQYSRQTSTTSMRRAAAPRDEVLELVQKQAQRMEEMQAEIQRLKEEGLKQEKEFDKNSTDLKGRQSVGFGRETSTSHLGIPSAIADNKGVYSKSAAEMFDKLLKPELPYQYSQPRSEAPVATTGLTPSHATPLQLAPTSVSSLPNGRSHTLHSSSGIVSAMSSPTVPYLPSEGHTGLPSETLPPAGDGTPPLAADDIPLRYKEFVQSNEYIKPFHRQGDQLKLGAAASAALHGPFAKCKPSSYESALWPSASLLVGDASPIDERNQSASTQRPPPLLRTDSDSSFARRKSSTKETEKQGVLSQSRSQRNVTLVPPSFLTPSDPQTPVLLREASSFSSGHSMAT